ncbi:MAG: Bax inhibitor-1 family protein [Planctomycetota bacterium]
MRKFAETVAWPRDQGFAIDVAVNERLDFIRRTYSHLLIELCGVGIVASMAMKSEVLMRNLGALALVGLLGLFLVVPRLIAPGASKASQYAGAALVTAFYGVLVAPLAAFLPTEVLLQAFILTSCVFGGLTAYVFVTKKDFSAWGGALRMALFAAIGMSLIGFFWGFGSTTYFWFNIGVVVLFCGFILYYTSNILRHYPTNAHVAASVQLLGAFVNLFIRIALILASSRD